MSIEFNIWDIVRGFIYINIVIGFILNIIVVIKTNRLELSEDILNGGVYYDYHIIISFTHICLIIVYLLLKLLNVIYVEDTNIYNIRIPNNTFNIPLIISIVIVLILIIHLISLGNIWEVNSHYSLLFYPEYWNTFLVDIKSITTIKSTNIFINKKIYYYLSDILVRIHSFVLMILFLGLGTFCLCCNCN